MIEPTFFERHKVGCIIGGLAAVLVLIGLLWWAYSDGGTTGEIPLINNIGIDQGKNAMQSNLIANQEKVVNNADTNGNRANANLANSVNRDSGTFSGNGADADAAFCGAFPCDGSCVEWRRTRPDIKCPR